MVGLSLRELPEETLHPGDTSEYHSWMFVGGDPRGQCIARVLRISQNEDPEYPIRVDTGEMLSERQVMRRISDASGVLFKVCKWRKLRTYIMKDGEVNLPTMSSRFNSALRQAVADGWAAASVRIQQENEQKKSRQPDDSDGEVEVTARSSSSNTSSTRTQPPSTVAYGSAQRLPIEENPKGQVLVKNVAPASNSDLIELDEMDNTSPSTSAVVGVVNTALVLSPARTEETTGSEDTSEHATDPIPREEEVLAAKDHLNDIPTRLGRNKIRHQAKKLAPASITKEEKHGNECHHSFRHQYLPCKIVKSKEAARFPTPDISSRTTESATFPTADVLP
ncbi:hypothetical protein GN958_ATG04608 [Phytophthora infestans]|uniref:Uncharacterized protein n=1 Tax=Phytophthora infestans TaxID=4787 RepID=A0A8S9V0M2_PHYIN|nr:hypothetical protein GN958_ATG04608 [Phytophthora infestans]